MFCLIVIGIGICRGNLIFVVFWIWWAIVFWIIECGGVVFVNILVLFVLIYLL